MNLNKAMIIGNLTRDPEVKTTPQGQTVASFSVATNMVWTDNAGQKQEKVEFHNIVAWRKLADVCGQYLKKGSKVYVEGRLQTREWTGQDSVKRYRTEIIAENMIMLDRAGTTPSQSMPTGRQQGGYSDHTISPEDAVGGPSQEISDDDIKVENIPF